MLYDARQRPQNVLLGRRLFIVFNGDATKTDNHKGNAYPMLVEYDLDSQKASTPVRLSEESSSDHHYCPIIWADERDHLHVLFGCHKTPGTHLVSTSPITEDLKSIEWSELPSIAPKISYPNVFRISGNRELIYYRTDGHTSSWTYKISEDNGETWSGPAEDVTDLDSKGKLDWSSYQTKILSADGKTLHVVFTDYDDNKHNPDPSRFFNRRYGKQVSNEWKYNLSYLKIDLEKHSVRNWQDQQLVTPVDIDYSRAFCQVWDTGGRGAGIPPAVALDRLGRPAFLHVLSGRSIKEHHYHFVRPINGGWRKDVITHSNHQWNSGHLYCDKDNRWHAFVIVGNSYLTGGYMNRHGGGAIEEWISDDGGKTWSRLRQIAPLGSEFVWKFNNVQPVVRPDNSLVDGMLVFYGWRNEEHPEAVAYLWHESNH